MKKLFTLWLILTLIAGGMMCMVYGIEHGGIRFALGYLIGCSLCAIAGGEIMNLINEDN